MARRTTTSGVRDAVPTVKDARTAPPPSTAAQLVEQHSHSINQNQPHSRVAFSQLLIELRECPTAIDSDLQSNYKLISVIAEAGFDVLNKDDPFSKKPPVDVSEIIACLDVIAIAVRCSPDVLFHSGEGAGETGSELCLWILPKLFWLLNYHDESVRIQAHGLLATFLSALSGSHKRRIKFATLMELYQVCTDDILFALQNLTSTKSGERSLDLILLSSEARSVVAVGGRQPVALRRSSQVRVSDAEHAYGVALALIQAVLRSTEPSSTLSSNLPVHSSRYQTWIIGSVLRLHDSLVHFLPQFEQDKCSRLGKTLLKVVNNMTLRMLKLVDSTTTLQKAGNLLIRCLMTFLSLPNLRAIEQMESQAITSVTLILRLSNVSMPIWEQARVTLLPVFSKIALHIVTKGCLSAEFENNLNLAIHKFGNLDFENKDTAQLGKVAHAASISTTNSTTQNVVLERRPTKRARTSREPCRILPKGDDMSGLLRRFRSVLAWDRPDLNGLDQAVQRLFPDLSISQKVDLFEIFVEMPCAVSAVSGLDKTQKAIGCGNCQAKGVQTMSGDIIKWDMKQWSLFYQALTALIKSPDVQSSNEYRVMAIVAIKTFTLHTVVADHRDLANSATGKLCIQALKSTSRELRVAASATLPVFLISSEYADATCRQNRILALDILRQLSEANDPKYHETSILAYGQIALVCEEEEKNIILLQLVEYLGHTNTLICGLAHLELRNVAQAASVPLQELLKPFWRTIGITVVKDIFIRPQKAQQLADMLGLSVNSFLLLTQAETLPYLVLWRKSEILERLATATEDGSVWDVCMNKQNLPGILSLLLVQQPSQIETAVGDALMQASPLFRDIDVANLLMSDVLSIACELLKMAGDWEGENLTNALQAFRAFMSIVERRSKSSSTQTKISAMFFDKHALGIMASFSEVVDNANESNLAKKRALRAIEKLLEVSQSNIRIALPQVRACLQSALEIDALRDQAFVSWTILLTVLPLEEDIECLVDHTFTAIVQHWNSFAPSTQQRAYDSIANLLKDHGPLIQNTVSLLPSLQSIPLMSKFESQLARFRNEIEISQRLDSFSERCRDENAAIILQALRELSSYLPTVQEWIHISAVAEQPHPSISALVRSLLDICIRYNEEQGEILELCGRCLGVIGCLDANRIEANREKREKVVMLSNFGQASEAVEFVSFLLETVLVNAFHSVSNPRAQGFLAYVMQELLRFCGFNKDTALISRPRASQIEVDESHQRWATMSESARSTLTPFLGSRYVLKTLVTKQYEVLSYPLFSDQVSHGTWLRTFVFDLLQRPKGDNANMIFGVLSRIIRGYDVSIASFLLPFAVTNVILGGTTGEVQDITREFLLVLQPSSKDRSAVISGNIKLCSQNVFEVLDYLSRWLQEKKKAVTTARNLAARSTSERAELEEAMDKPQIACVENVLSSIPADILSKRAVECGSYARALFHWEQYIRQQKEQAEKHRMEDSQKDKNHADKTQVERKVIEHHDHYQDSEALYQHLHEIYSQIDEPDGLQGISSCLHVLSSDQQIAELRNAGRWAAAQTWYELRLKEEPNNLELNLSVLQCLQDAGQHLTVLDRVKCLSGRMQMNDQILSVTCEAAWCADRWEDLEQCLTRGALIKTSSFNVEVGQAMLAMRLQDSDRFLQIINHLRSAISRTLSAASADSLQACHHQLLKLHALYEVEMLHSIGKQPEQHISSVHTRLNQRLEVIGASLPDKRYLLNIRRAAMQLSSFDHPAIALLWMQTAKLARKGNLTDIAYDAVLHASQLGDESSKMEQARLLWKDGKHQKAIRSLESAIGSNVFKQRTDTIASAAASMSVATNHESENRHKDQNVLLARAHLLLAKWLDAAGQTQSSIINQKYQHAVKSFSRWEKGSYHLGKFYNKLLDTEKALPAAKQSVVYLMGDAAKLVIENYLRSMMFGCKYLFQTLPKILTLWLDFGIDVHQPISKDVPDDVRRTATEQRPKILLKINQQIKNKIDRIPTYVFYTALAQMVTRISHPEQEVYVLLASLIVKIVAVFPQQGLWPLLALMKSSSTDRASRGMALLNKVKEKAKSIRNEGQSIDPRNLVAQGQKLSNQLLRACEVDLKGSAAIVSLTKDLGFNVKIVPCGLVIPLEKTLTASLPTTTDILSHKAFPATRDAVTISSFIDDVLVLNSLQRPRKLTVLGSDGRRYGILIKPKDDLRKDQRLMEFNTFVNRSLRKDAESSKRRLYIKTYAVTPLNEECGLIEWVDGLKPLRDIIASLYKSKNIKIDYNLLKQLLDEACATPDGHRIFSNQILSMYKPVLHEWFTEHFPDADGWFAARLRYTRSCAVTSVLGYALGLGDRHGENVLLEEKDGGVFHVDFNCLFEKGLTFDKPEKIPFRLTHNMVDAFGAYGVEGPFRRSAECAMSVMRSNEDALLTILETFVYDPTADFMGPGPRRKVRGVPETPKEMLESVKSKMRGLMRGESVPLSVEGHVDALIRQATDPANLCAMYIGWCPFL